MAAYAASTSIAKWGMRNGFALILKVGGVGSPRRAL